MTFRGLSSLKQERVVVEKVVGHVVNLESTSVMSKHLTFSFSFLIIRKFNPTVSSIYLLTDSTPGKYKRGLIPRVDTFPSEV